MKFERDQCSPFVPITITLESEEELVVVTEILGMHPDAMISNSDLDDADMIKRALNKQGDWNNSAYAELNRIQER